MAAIPPQPDCCIEGARVVIRPLRFRDLPEIAGWEPHSDPLLAPYNLSIDSAAGWRHWLQFEKAKAAAGTNRHDDEIPALSADRGRYLGFVRMIAREGR